MKLTEGRREGEGLINSLFGHVDSGNAAQLEEEIEALRARDPGGALTLDLEGLGYISSAGLRVILRLRKREPELRLINASSEVYEIFDMTGFTEMLPIEKAYRRMSVEGCEVIGEGANGLVYRLDPDTIIKVYRNPDSLPDIRRERELARADFLRPHLPEAEGKKLRSLIEAVPENFHMMHGDYHIKNVMLQDGEALLIDMDTLCMGNPVFEFASIFLAYEGFSELDHAVSMRFLGIPHDMAVAIWEKTLGLYFAGRGEAELAGIEDRAKVIGYARLMRRTIRREGDTEHGRAQIELCRQRLGELLARVDSLAI